MTLVWRWWSAGLLGVFYFKQKTAYEMRISDWSSDVCSSDLAIAYMLANSSMGRTDATAEVERYIAYPGQALSYKVGQITIRRLRDRAEAALGARFDIRALHGPVLTTGALPMAILEAKIDTWIASQKGGTQARPDRNGGRMPAN